ncbi:MAG: hypothetical protein ACOCVT_02005 [bacterium]
MSLIDGEPRSASLYAKSDTVILLVMSKENFRELLEESPQIGVQILWKLSLAMSKRLRMTSGVLIEALENDPDITVRRDT